MAIKFHLLSVDILYLCSPKTCSERYFCIKLTLILPEPKVNSLCPQYRVKPACTSVQSDQALYCWQTNFNSHIDIPKMRMDFAKNEKWSILFKKFGRLRFDAFSYKTKTDIWTIYFISNF